LAEHTFELRVPYYKLIIGMLVTIVPISLAALYSITQSTGELQRSIGNERSALARAIASEVALFIRSHVTEAGLSATDTAVLAVVRESNRVYENLSAQQISDRIEAIESVWNTPAGAAHFNRMLSSPASQALRRKLAIDIKFLRATVTDIEGATVAASHKTLDSFQADEEYWHDIYAIGRGAVSLTDVLYDEATKANYIGIGVPITEPETGQLLGTFDALVDVSSLFPLVQQSDIGTEGRVLLVRGDGTIIAGSGGENLSIHIGNAALVLLKGGDFFRIRRPTKNCAVAVSPAGIVGRVTEIFHAVNG
jgi:hypothetical protein